MSAARFFGRGLALASVILLASVAQGQTTWYVDAANACPGAGTQEDPFCRIQPCINASVDGDTCLVADGTYTGPFNRNINFGGRLITLQSVNGSGACIIDCQGVGRGFIFTSGETEDAVVDGFTVRNGSSGSTGAGMNISNNSDPTITNCVLTANTAPFGAAMYNNSSSPTVTHCVFSDNTATTLAGGMFNDNNSSPTVIDCTFRGNSAGALGGGMINTVFSHATVTNCLFIENEADLGAGMLNDNSSNPTATNCTFIGNASLNGGAMLSNHNCHPTVANSIMWDNTPNQIVNMGGSTTTVTYSDVQGGWPGGSNMNEDPLFAPGPLGCHYLSQTVAGQDADSPCADAGDPDSPLVGGATRSDHLSDTGLVDMGFHYPLSGPPQDVSEECAPVIVHAEVIPGQTRPCSGYIDPRSESSDGVNEDLGLAEVTLLFSQPVFSPDGGSLAPADFIVSETGGEAPPDVAAVNADDNPRIVVTLDRIITLQEWTTIQAVVENVNAIPIEDYGDRGPGMQEPDRLDVAYLPADVNQSGANTPFDLLTFRQYVNGLLAPSCGPQTDYTDMNRDGNETPFDLLRLRQLINGLPPSTRDWAGMSLNDPRP